MIWDWDYALDVLPKLLDALIVTVQAALAGFAIALVLGLMIALARRSGKLWLSVPVGAIAEFIRSTPLLVQLYFLFFVMPGFGVQTTPFITGVIGLGLHYATYTAEVYRAGLDAVPRGQWEAAWALDFSPLHTFRSIILPQALPPVVPVLGNYLIAIFKDTPLLSAITVLEMMQVAKIEGSETFQYLEPLTIVGLLFLIVSLISAVLIGRLENHFGALRRI
jgi:polar amino acid transport system permease protein